MIYNVRVGILRVISKWVFMLVNIRLYVCNDIVIISVLFISIYVVFLDFNNW